ncbi:hypothetical protein BU14_0121s0033 [Porphyra umbilicalis]|uniref:Uncharacterized protein n=1 Tax=Porphyra umbilicalis TaxID=2786 RepID=A0A1X6PBK8_PORUM|nr:hypothetical protein BU14_0121s0033 [Porphyra umbilicalis]|eukprot:OSX78105.1 hypothetical protein BU14_0121s0033 [Porphyra umbilicalis]
MAHPSSATKAYTAKWLQAVAYVFCRPPLSSFVAGDGYQLCGQAEGRADPHVAATAGGTAVQAHDAEWTFDPDQRAGGPDRPAQPGATPLPPCAFPDDSAAGGIDWPRDRPAWLLGRGSREVNPASADEVALAQSIAACAHPLGAKRFVELRRIKWSPAARYGPAIGVAESLSHRFDGAVWGVEPPDDPTSATNLILALSVVVPAALALVTVLMTGRSWSKRDVAALVLVFVAGLVSSAGLVGLAVVEARAQAWRGASLRNELAVRIHENGSTPVMRHLTHMPLYRVETLYLAARTGYRLNLIVSLASVVLSAYVVLFAAVTCCAAYRWRRPKKVEPARPRTPRSPRDRLGGGGVVASDEVDIEARVETCGTLACTPCGPALRGAGVTPGPGWYPGMGRAGRRWSTPPPTATPTTAPPAPWHRPPWPPARPPPPTPRAAPPPPPAGGRPPPTPPPPSLLPPSAAVPPLPSRGTPPNGSVPPDARRPPRRPPARPRAGSTMSDPQFGPNRR